MSHEEVQFLCHSHSIIMMKYVLDPFPKFFSKGLINKHSNFPKKAERSFFKNAVCDSPGAIILLCTYTVTLLQGDLCI